MHDPGPVLERRRIGAAGERAHPAQPLAARLVVADLEEPLRGPAQQLQLIDRLPGPVLTQLGWPVGGQDEQGHARLAGLDRGGQELGGCRSRGAGDRDGHARGLGEAEREEAGAALVDVGIALKARLVRERQRSGALRDPGEVQAARIPQRASSSTNARSSR